MNTENQQHFAPVLVVEDEEDHSRLIIKALNQAGQIMNSIILVENGQDAIDFVSKPIHEEILTENKYLVTK